jgi:hypothetical protein
MLVAEVAGNQRSPSMREWFYRLEPMVSAIFAATIEVAAWDAIESWRVWRAFDPPKA